MKRNFFLTLSFALMITTYSCGGNKETLPPTIQEETKEEKPKGPISDREWSYDYTEILDGHQYQISIHRHSNSKLPIIKDELGQEYYDNCAELTILRDGKKFYSKTFTKDAFWDFLSEADRKNSMLQGLAFDQPYSDGLQFGAQIGLPDGEGGPAFIVTISKKGTMSIMKDHNQDTQGEY